MLFATISVVVLIFGCVTYVISWNVDLFFERQILVSSSTLMVIWSLSLVVKLKTHLRLLTGILLLIGASLSTWVLITLADPVMYTIGLACVSGLSLYILLLIRELLQSRMNVGPESHIDDDEEIKVIVQ